MLGLGGATGGRPGRARGEGSGVKVAEVMRPRFAAVGPGTAILEAVRAMTTTREEALPVVDGGRLVGVVAERDVLGRLFEELSPDVYVLGVHSVDADEAEAFRRVGARPVAEVMETRVVTVGPDLPALRAAAIMRVRRVRRLPVVAGDRLLGVVFQRDVLAALLEQVARDASPGGQSP